VGAAQIRAVNRLFGWANDAADRTVKKLVEKRVAAMAEHPKLTGEWIALIEVCR
jgi:hypothetical protein